MIDPAAIDRLVANWNQVVDEVRQAGIEAGRSADSVTVVGVTKYVDAEVTRSLVEAGCANLGENRPQSLWQKAETLSLGSTAQWHVIGHLQRNKIRRTLRQRPIIHSIDSARLLAAVAEESVSENISTPVLLEVNVSGEAAKTGMSREEVRGLLNTLPAEGVEVIGIMAMAGWGTDSAASRRQFAATREFRDSLIAEFGLPLPHLSMGMSGDFVEAISEGSTLVRIGSRLFNGVVEIS